MIWTNHTQSILSKLKFITIILKIFFIYFQLLHFIWRDVRTRRRNAPRKPCPGARTPWRWSRTTRTSASPPHKKSFKKCARKLLLMTSQKHLPFDQIFLQVMSNFKFARFFLIVVGNTEFRKTESVNTKSVRPESGSVGLSLCFFLS